MESKTPEKISKIHRLAIDSEVEVKFRELGKGLYGLCITEDIIVINGLLKGMRKEFVIAHELGHIKAKRSGVFEYQGHESGESYADGVALGIIAEHYPKFDVPSKWLFPNLREK